MSPTALRRPGTGRLLGAALLAVMAGSGAAQAAGKAAGLKGSWRGPVAENSLGGQLKEVRAELDPGGDGLSASWSAPDGQQLQVDLQPTARPGVLAARTGGFRAMLGGAKVASPLAGEPLFWGRRGEAGVYVYRLEIGTRGELKLDRYAFEPAEGGALAFTASRVGRDGAPVGVLHATLKREGS